MTDEKQDLIKEALYGGIQGIKCGCWKRECPNGCGIVVKAIDLWTDVRKTLYWARKKTNGKEPSTPDNLINRLHEEFDDLIKRLDV